MLLRATADAVSLGDEKAIDSRINLRTFAFHYSTVERANVVQVDIYREPIKIEVEHIKGSTALENEAPGEKRVPVNLNQRLQQPDCLLKRTRLVSRLSSDTLQGLGRGRRHSKAFKPAFDNIGR